MMVINFILILNRIHQNLNIQHEQVEIKYNQKNQKNIFFYFNLVDTTRRRKQSTDNNPTNSSTSSDDDKITPPVEMSPFSFDSLQKLAQKNDANNNNQTSFELDYLYPSIDKNIQMNKNDEDDDLLLAAATAACTNIKTK